VRQKDKPYRVYRGGRTRGPIQPLRPPSDDASAQDWRPTVEEEQDGLAAPAVDVPPPEPPSTPPAPQRERPPRRRGRRIALWIALTLLFALLLFVGWGTFGYFAFRGGVKDANARLPTEARQALSTQHGSLLSSPTNILLLGVDHGPAREGDTGRSDAIVLVHTDPDHHRLSMLSIPRDLRIEIPQRGFAKINAAYSIGGTALAVKSVESLTGIGINHVAVVDFSTFADVIDAVGGITVDVPRKIVSNRFDCPYASRADCERWRGWRFAKGRQTMNGHRALVYSRIRENQLDPSENDLTRGGRQQQVVQALADKLVSFNGFVHLPFWGSKVVKPLATDLSATQLLELGWVKFRAATTLRCRLGGQPATLDGVWYLIGSEDNASVVAMALGQAAPQPPRPGEGLFGAGCTSSK
jgi:LCP family protein required for cell wall assembly